jgi:hypothetical protein
VRERDIGSRQGSAIPSGRQHSAIADTTQETKLMKTRIVAIAVMGLGAWVAPTSAQIIATSIPRADVGQAAAGEKKFAFHILAAPVSKWKYGEIYIGGIDQSAFGYGTVQATPNGDFLFAGETAFKASNHWTIGGGGWYNKVGKTTFEFEGDVLTDTNFFGMTADFDGDLKMFEGHANIFYKDIGVQAGIIRTTGTIGTNATIKTFTFNGQTVNCATATSPDDCKLQIPTDAGNTTDWDIFAVYKHSWSGKTPIGVSAGPGIYRKQGTSDTPLRSGEANTLFTAFVTANVEIYKGLGIDTSFWYIDKTEATKGGDRLAGAKSGDSQSRFTLGVGYTFSK